MKAGQKTKRPTLQTIADISGFAVPTVSRALADAPDISASTKLLVRRIANDIGYVPDRAGVRLRTGRTNVISLVISTEQDVMNLTSHLISSIAGGLRNTALHLVVTPDFPDDDPLQSIRYIVRNRAADAIIINRIQIRDPRVEFLMEQGFPFVTHGRTIWADQHAYVDYDNRLFGRSAVEKLAERGRRKILLIAPPLEQNYALEIVEGANEAAASTGIEVIRMRSVNIDSHIREVREHVRKQVLSDPEIDGLISASPNATMAAVAGIEDAGLQLGPKFDVLSKETIPILGLFRPQILVAEEDITKAGGLLAEAAIRAAREKNEPPLQHLEAGPETVQITQAKS